MASGGSDEFPGSTDEEQDFFVVLQLKKSAK